MAGVFRRVGPARKKSRRPPSRAPLSRFLLPLPHPQGTLSNPDIYIYMCVCVYIFMCVCVYIYIYIYIYPKGRTCSREEPTTSFPRSTLSLPITPPTLSTYYPSHTPKALTRTLHTLHYLTPSTLSHTPLSHTLHSLTHSTLSHPPLSRTLHTLHSLASSTGVPRS